MSKYSEFDGLSAAWETMTDDDQFAFACRISIWIHKHQHRYTPAECFRAVKDLLDSECKKEPVASEL
ncbi:MAG: hypothetical protein KAJ19_02950, partial [Gammaproteobacteria bacterium]|nr:hypothetical protein [Gammaproteobacteria bacterium]